MTSPTPDPSTNPAPAGWRRFRPGRRTAVIAASVVGLLLVIGVVGALLVPGGAGRGRGDHGPGGPDAVLLGDVGELGLADGLDGGGSGGHGGPGDRRDGRGGPGFGPLDRRLGDDTLLAGTVVSAADGSLVLTPDGAPQRTVRTDDDTRVFGGGNRAVGDLEAGERVVLRIDGTGDTATVVAAFAPQARVIGTVTTLAGNQATVVAVNGLTVTADVTGIGQQPAVGDLVVLTGGANGATLRADEVRVLPKAS